MWWPGNSNGSAEEAALIAEALAEAARIAIEWAKEDTTNEFSLPHKL